MVWSENTTPQPNVSSAAFRSTTVTSWAESAFFMRRAKYNPAGPPLITTTLTPPHRSRVEHPEPVAHSSAVGAASKDARPTARTVSAHPFGLAGGTDRT